MMFFFSQTNHKIKSEIFSLDEEVELNYIIIVDQEISVC
jgi:hypothetical protein